MCGKYAKYAGATACGKAEARAPTGTTPTAAATAASLRFTPTGDEALRQVADDRGHTPQERQPLLQAFSATKAAFEQRCGERGWRHNVDGACAYFIASIAQVRSGTEAEAAAPNRLFDALAATLAASPDLACASNADNAVLYDTRIANTGLPLLYYLDGTKTRTAAEIEQARALAAASSRRILHAEPAALVAMLPTAAPMRQAPHQPRGGAAGVGGGGCSCASRRTMAPAVARITFAPADALPRSPPGPRGTAGARAARPA